MAVSINRGQNLIVFDLGKPVAWLSLGPDAARQFALLILRKAGELDGKITTVTTR